MYFPHRTKLLFLVALLNAALIRTQCLEFNFSNFTGTDSSRLIFGNETTSAISSNAIQVTLDLSNSPNQTSRILDLSGRVLYNEKLGLWTRKGANAQFNTSFVLNISNKTDPGGEGLAFILTEDHSVPESSSGQWLGIVSPKLNGTSQANTVAIEFDTRKSYLEDLDDNHVGLDVNSVYSIKQVSLSGRNVALSLINGVDVYVLVQYDGTNLSVFVGNDSENPVLSEPIDLSAHLPRKVYVGFSGSTSNFTELNCVKSWSFNGSDIKNDGNVTFWVVVLVGPVLLVTAFGVIFMYWRRRSRRLALEAYPRIEEEINGLSTAPTRFKLKELRKATGKFSPKNQLGSGGFGTVYKGTLGDKDVAVKRIRKDKAQGKQEFIAEVTTIGNLHHRNLVKLIGWCYERSEFLIVYECMPNGSLEKLIFTDKNSDVTVQTTLSWKRRVNIVSGVAQAVEYLHNGCEKTVLHRDIKASNIMLDSEFDARLGDFGLARTIKQRDQTHHSTKVLAGTPGYMAPEFLFEGKATIWTDVYAFGVLVLEVACGRKSVGQSEEEKYSSNIVNWVWELHRSGAIVDAADPRLIGDFDKEDMECLLVLGLACCHPNPSKRPSMKSVHQVLKGEAPPPDVPNERPRFVWPALPSPLKDKDSFLTSSQLVPFSQLNGR